RAVFQFIPSQIDDVTNDRNLRMMRDPLGRHALSNAETLTGGRESIENADGWPAVGRVVHQRRPDHMNLSAAVQRKRWSIFWATFDLPLVFTDPNRCRERSAAVARRGKRHIADVLRIDVPPGEVEPVVWRGYDCGLAAIAHASSNRTTRSRIIEDHGVEL